MLIAVVTLVDGLAAAHVHSTSQAMDAIVEERRRRGQRRFVVDDVGVVAARRRTARSSIRRHRVVHRPTVRRRGTGPGATRRPAEAPRLHRLPSATSTSVPRSKCSGQTLATLGRAGVVRPATDRSIALGAEGVPLADVRDGRGSTSDRTVGRRAPGLSSPTEKSGSSSTPIASASTHCWTRATLTPRRSPTGANPTTLTQRIGGRSRSPSSSTRRRGRSAQRQYRQPDSACEDWNCATRTAEGS